MEKSGGAIFITLKTLTKFYYEPRNVSIMYDDFNNEITLLGELPHGTRLIIDQELVNELQKIVNIMKG